MTRTTLRARLPLLLRALGVAFLAVNPFVPGAHPVNWALWASGLWLVVAAEISSLLSKVGGKS